MGEIILRVGSPARALFTATRRTSPSTGFERIALIPR